MLPEPTIIIKCPRNHGRFGESKTLIESIADKDYFWITDKYLKAIEQKNPELFRLR